MNRCARSELIRKKMQCDGVWPDVEVRDFGDDDGGRDATGAPAPPDRAVRRQILVADRTGEDRPRAAAAQRAAGRRAPRRQGAQRRRQFGRNRRRIAARYETIIFKEATLNRLESLNLYRFLWH